MDKEDVDKLIKELHDITIKYAKKYPDKIDITAMDEADEQLRQKLYKALGIKA
jgi:hypothetical protein